MGLLGFGVQLKSNLGLAGLGPAQEVPGIVRGINQLFMAQTKSGTELC